MAGGTMARSRIGFAIALLVGIGAQGAVAQEAAAPAAAASAVPAELATGTVAREIDDPASGLRWLLVEDPAHPGGPGRLVSLSPDKRMAKPRSLGKVAAAEVVIHAGETVQVEEHSAVIDANLEVVALSSAAPGGPLRVRLRIGGRVVKARVIAAGRAVREPSGGRP